MDINEDIKFPSKNKIDDEFAKNVGAKNLSDLKKLKIGTKLIKYLCFPDTSLETNESVLSLCEDRHHFLLTFL